MGLHCAVCICSSQPTIGFRMGKKEKYVLEHLCLTDRCLSSQLRCLPLLPLPSYSSFLQTFEYSWLWHGKIQIQATSLQKTMGGQWSTLTSPTKGAAVSTGNTHLTITSFWSALAHRTSCLVLSAPQPAANNIIPLLWRFEFGGSSGPSQQEGPLARCQLTVTPLPLYADIVILSDDAAKTIKVHRDLQVFGCNVVNLQGSLLVTYEVSVRGAVSV